MAATREQRRTLGQQLRRLAYPDGVHPFPTRSMCFALDDLVATVNYDRGTMKELRAAIGSVVLPSSYAFLPSVILDGTVCTDKDKARIRRWWLRAWEETGVAKTRADWLAEAQARKEKRQCSAS